MFYAEFFRIISSLRDLVNFVEIILKMINLYNHLNLLNETF